MPMRREAYPPEWEAFSKEVRFGRAQGKCEACGVPNGHLRYKSAHLDGGEEIVDPANTSRLLELEGWLCDLPYTVSKIVLTVAHLDHKGGPCDCEKQTGRKCARADHVLALCQRDHLAMDIPRHVFNARRTRARKAGQQWLGDMESR